MEELLTWYSNLVCLILYEGDMPPGADNPIAEGIDYHKKHIYPADISYSQKYTIKLKSVFVSLSSEARNAVAYNIIQLGRDIYRDEEHINYYLDYFNAIIDKDITTNEDEYFFEAFDALMVFLHELLSLCALYSINIAPEIHQRLRRFIETYAGSPFDHEYKKIKQIDSSSQSRGRIKAIYALWYILDRNYPDVSRAQKALFIEAVTGGWNEALTKTPNSTYAYKNRPKSRDLARNDVKELLLLLNEMK